MRLLSLSKYLLEEGYGVSVLCLSEECIRSFDPKGLSATIPEGVDVFTYGITTKHWSHVKKNSINEKEFERALNKLLSERSFDAAIVSVGPFYTLKPVIQVKKKGIPYIVDYRDLNISSPEKRKRNGIIRKCKMWMSFPCMYLREKKCLEDATYVTVVAPEMRENITEFFRIDEGKFAVAYNGYDDVTLNDVKLRVPDPAQFTIGYFGKLMYYNQKLTRMLFSAIEDLNRQGTGIRFLHIGPENPAIQDYFAERGFNQNDWYYCTGQMNYKEGIKLLSSCNAFALEYAYPEGPGTKVFDYIYLNRPIVGVTKPGISLEKLLRRFDYSFICHTQQEIMNAFLYLVSHKNLPLMDGETTELNAFSRSKQNRIFKNLLEKIERGI